MLNRISADQINELKEYEVFVFGSNGNGDHLGGAARIAYRKFGAVWGQAEGLQGQSYAINTMDGIEVIKEHISRFIDCATKMPGRTFLVTEIGCGIAGLTVEQIAPLFLPAKNIPNIHLPHRFWSLIQKQG